MADTPNRVIRSVTLNKVLNFTYTVYNKLSFAQLRASLNCELRSIASFTQLQDSLRKLETPRGIFYIYYRKCI